MTALRSPLKDRAPLPVDEVTAQRLFRGVVARRERRRESGLRRRAVVWFAVGALSAVVPTALFESRRARPARSLAAEGGPLTRVDGAPFAALSAPPGGGATTVRLSDESIVSVDPGTRLEPLENGAHSLVLLLARGRATFDVRPGGPRHWSIECGLATVEVVGTRFVLSRTSDRLDVDVDRGTVLVRGERVPERVQRVTAGGHLEVVGSALQVGGPTPTDSAVPAVPVAQPTAVPAPTASAARPWRELATRGAYADAYRLLGSRGVGSEVARSVSVKDLMTLADVARLSGHPADATAPLERIVAEHPDDGRASLAAFTLGKIHLNSVARPGEAARDFERAILMGLPAGLLEDAYAYLVEAKERAGDVTGARAAARAYGARFPDSPRAHDLSKRVGP
jgi:transmembrane sensor